MVPCEFLKLKPSDTSMIPDHGQCHEHTRQFASSLVHAASIYVDTFMNILVV